MQASSIASAYLRSLVHFPNGHFCTLTQRPLPRMLTLDFELWMDGFEAALDASGFAGPLPTRDEIRWYVDVAVARYFAAAVPLPESAAAHPSTHGNSQGNTSTRRRRRPSSPTRGSVRNDRVL